MALKINNLHSSDLKRALLIVDRGSREPEVRQELETICQTLQLNTKYHFVTYCFLEVTAPFITEGINSCIRSGADFITIMPLFLYPGLKLKDSVKQSARLAFDKKLRVVIAKPLSYHPLIANLVRERVSEVKAAKSVELKDSECDILLIGHGSSDRNARRAFLYTVNQLQSHYRNVSYCFLELDTPNIGEGIRAAIGLNPKIVIIAPYFLHKGAHIKKDVFLEVNNALKDCGYLHAVIAQHFGVHEKLVNIVLDRLAEVEARVGF